MYYIQHCSLLSLQTYSNTCKTWSHNPACHTSRVAVVFGQCVCVWHFGHETNESLSQSPFIWGSEDFPDNKAFIFFLANSEKHTLEKTHTLWEKHMCGSKMCTHTHTLDVSPKAYQVQLSGFCFVWQLYYQCVNEKIMNN